MVQFRPGVKGNPADYWKLTRPRISVPQLKRYLRDNQFYAPSSAKKDRLLTQALTRSLRGLLSYDGCNLLELKTSCAQRAVQIPNEDTLTKLRLVEALETADEMAEFTRYPEAIPGPGKDRVLKRADVHKLEEQIQKYRDRR